MGFGLGYLFIDIRFSGFEKQQFHEFSGVFLRV